MPNLRGGLADSGRESGLQDCGVRRGASASPGDAARRARRSPGYRYPVVPVAEARSAPQVHCGRSPKGGIRERQALRRAAAVSVSSVASRGVRAGPSILFLRERSQRRSKGMKAMDARYATGEHSTGVFRRHSYGQVFFCWDCVLR